MPTAPPPNPQTSSLTPDAKARQRGRLGLAPAWENIPWWGVIILIVGIIAGFSVLTSVRYLDALRFIFDLPWNKNIVRELDAAAFAADGSWTHTFSQPLRPGAYTFYAEFIDQNGDLVGRDTVYQVRVAKDATAVVQEMLPAPTGAPLLLQTTTPTLSGRAPAGTAKVRLIDDFRNQPLRVAHRIWTANGIILTIRTTILAFAAAIFIGLIFGIMRVSSGSPDLRRTLVRRLAVGLVVAGILLVLRPAWRTPTGILLTLLITEVIFFLLPAMPYTISTLYVEIVRGVPMLVIILYMGFAISPALRAATQDRLDLRGLPAAVIGLAFGYGAYLAEVFRAGIQSIPRGQMEAARSLGMNYFQAMRTVILPQAIRMILPPLGNDFIAMLKDSSLISVIALPEVLQQGRLWISRNFRAFEGYNSVMLIYLVMTLMLSLLVRSIERRAALPGR